MSPLEIVAILALTGYAIFKQTQVAAVSDGFGRFRMALIYAVVGVVIGGFALPDGLVGAAMIVVSLLLSLVIGLVRGRLTKVWIGPDGRVMRQGTWVTVAWFLGLIVAKFALGTVAYFYGIADGAGLGEIMVMIAIMIAVQAELVYRRGIALREAQPEAAAPATA